MEQNTSKQRFLQHHSSFQNIPQFLCSLAFELLVLPLQCKELQELLLNYHQTISNEGLAKVGKGCSQFQALHLVDCSLIGDFTICSILVSIFVICIL
uniref:Uncharacterized protein n=1 Tax=Physcomitrium patens TaxID=3218 RepID=A0A7I4C290_PHYPA